jgi:hypothetical protein
MDTIRLSLLQSPAYFPPTYSCAALRKAPLLFHLERGDSILVRALGKNAEIIPPAGNLGNVFPFFPITVAGPTMTAQRPVAFRIIDAGKAFTQVCAKPRLIRAARAAAR